MLPYIDIRLIDGPVHAASFDDFPAACGGECVFLGRTRAEDHPAHGPLVALDYEAYPGMAEREMTALAERACADFDDLHAVRLWHAVGRVAVGEASVLVQVAAGHRGGAFAAARFLIDELKRSVPVWKKETWSDGTTWSDGAPVTPEATS
jgi:molybdopterin synthase catalytic subunit